MAYASLTIYLFTTLQKACSSCEPKEVFPHAGLYIYNGMQTERLHFHMKSLIMDKLAVP